MAEPLTIAIDARWIFPEISGIGAYTRELVRALAGIECEDRFLLLFQDAGLRDRTLRETGVEGHPRFPAALLAHGSFSLRNQVSLPRWLHTRGVAVYHTTNYMMPLLPWPFRPGRGPAMVATIHDVIPMIFPGHAPRSRKSRLYPVYRRLMVAIGRRADAIVTDSHASRADVLHHLRIPAARAQTVRAIHLGVSERFLRSPRRQAAHADPDRVRTMLYVGRLDPYKNVPALVQVLDRVRRSAPFPVRLRIAGSPDARYPEAQQTAARLGLSDWTEWTGYLDDEALVAAYREADVLVHPSRYEGFGLQVAEAMAMGLPVVCTPCGSLAEVVGEAALTADPDDIEGLSAHVTRVLTDPTSAAALSAAGRARAMRFRWDATARATWELYHEIGETPHERR